MKKAMIVLLSSLIAGLALNAQAASVSLDSRVLEKAAETRPICSMPPNFTAVAIGPQEIRAQSDRDVEIVIAGILLSPDDCEVKAGYTLESNTGLLQGNITIAPDGSFNKKFIANVSRSGLDKDGRVYNGTLIAVDEDGDKATIEYTLTVLHDKSSKQVF